MPDNANTDQRGPEVETPAEHRHRVQQEAEIIAQARAEIAAGQGIDDDALEAWLDRLDHDGNAPLPMPSTSRT